MSKHTIHGYTIEVAVYQGTMTDTARGRCVGKVVNLCREYPEADFRAAMDDMAASLQGGPALSRLLAYLDSALADGYTKRTTDDFAPIASLTVTS